MIRLLTKFALYALAVAAVADIARYRRRELDRAAHKEALTTWEHEGGSQLPSPSLIGARLQRGACPPCRTYTYKATHPDYTIYSASPIPS